LEGNKSVSPKRLAACARLDSAIPATKKYHVMHDLGASSLSAGLQNLDGYPVEDQSA
jgi:hypothetical protein